MGEFTDLFKLAKRESHPRTRIRMLAVGHVKSGLKKVEVARMFCTRRSVVHTWVCRYESLGLDGLKEGQRSGRRQMLPKEQEAAFRCEVEKLQERLPGGRVRGQDVQDKMSKR